MKYKSKRAINHIILGFTLLEAVASIVILTIATTGLLTGLNMGIKLAQTAKNQTLITQKATAKLEEEMAMPYSTIQNGTFVNSASITQNSGVFLDWAITTTVSEVIFPVKYKQITVDAVWSKDGKYRFKRYRLLKSP